MSHWKVAGLFFATLGGAQLVFATTYSFSTGKYDAVDNFVVPCGAGLCANYSSTESPFGHFKTAMPLAPNLSYAPITMTEFSFNDGIHTYASSDPNVRLAYQAFVYTDANGNVTYAELRIQRWLTGSNPHTRGDRVAQFATDGAYAYAKNNSYCSVLTTPESGLPDACLYPATDGSMSQAVSSTGGAWTTLPQGRLSANSPVNFGYYAVGTSSANQAIAVTNVGGADVSISSVSLSDVTNFGESTSGCSTVSVGSFCTINIAFTPQSTGTFNATITITSDGAGSPQRISLTGVGLGSGGSGTTTSLVEYHHTVWDHYFVTGIPDEIAKLDAGVFVGWARTGQVFNAFALGSPRTLPTCRFFSTSFAPRSSHFYTPFATECALVKTSPDWQFEAEVFGVLLPDLAGNCQAGTTQLYRLYNNGQGGAPNHRYTTDPATVQLMRAAGWVSEGNGPNVVFACVPA